MAAVTRTERLVLRPLEPGDVDSIVDQVGDFRVAGKLARVPYPYHRSDAEEFIAWVSTLDSRSSVRAIALTSAPERLFGIISYEFSEAKGNAELGYWLAVPMWGQGYGTEAAKAMVADAFLRAGQDTLVSCYFNDNPASGKVLRRAGFEEAGPCTCFCRARGEEVPVTNMRLTRQHWIDVSRT